MRPDPCALGLLCANLNDSLGPSRPEQRLPFPRRLVILDYQVGLVELACWSVQGQSILHARIIYHLLSKQYSLIDVVAYGVSFRGEGNEKVSALFFAVLIAGTVVRHFARKS